MDAGLPALRSGKWVLRWCLQVFFARQTLAWVVSVGFFALPDICGILVLSKQLQQEVNWTLTTAMLLKHSVIMERCSRFAFLGYKVTFLPFCSKVGLTCFNHIFYLRQLNLKTLPFFHFIENLEMYRIENDTLTLQGRQETTHFLRKTILMKHIAAEQAFFTNAWLKGRNYASL